MNYDVDYFISKFSVIPSKLWAIGTRTGVGGSHCAHGWCMSKDGSTSYEEKCLSGLARLLTINGEQLFGFAKVNNAKSKEFPQSTPKKRVLAALRHIKKMQDGKTEVTQPEPKKERVRIERVAVPISISEQAKELIQN